MKRVLIFTIMLIWATGECLAAKPPKGIFTPGTGQIIITFPERELVGQASVTLVTSAPRQGVDVITEISLPDHFAPTHTLQGGKKSAVLTIPVPGDVFKPRVPSQIQVWLSGLSGPDGDLGRFRVLVDTSLSFSFELGRDARNLLLTFKSRGFRPTVEWPEILKWLNHLSTFPDKIKLNFTPSETGTGVKHTRNVIAFRPKPAPVPDGNEGFTFQVEVRAAEAPPKGNKAQVELELDPSLLADTVPGVQTVLSYEEIGGKMATKDPVSMPASLATAADSEHKFKNNFELGGTFTSAVTEKKDPMTGEKSRSRDNLGVLDLQFVPVIRQVRRKEVEVAADPQKQHYPWEHFVTPFFADLVISTGPELKHSQQNRISLGAEYELRKLEDSLGTSIRGNVYRFLFRGVQNTDRDFKDFEHNFEFDHRIAVGRVEELFYKLNQRESRFQLTLGTDLGATSTRRSEFELRELKRPLDRHTFLRRLRFGGLFDWNIISVLTFHLEDVLYIRGGERFEQDRAKNYFKASLEAPIFRPSERSSFVAFSSFERGDKPPFTLPSINSFLVGFRYRTNWNK